MGEGDHKCSEGHARIATEKVRDKHDFIIVQEKLDGSNVSIAKLDGVIYPLGRSGYLAISSPYEQHRHFANWVLSQVDRFSAILEDGERLCGEWLMQAHGTRYKLQHEPFVVFDLMRGHERIIYEDLRVRVAPADLIIPKTIHTGGPLSIEKALDTILPYGFHGAIDQVEGAVWRIERNELISPHKGDRRWVVDTLVKFVRPDKVDGLYLPEKNGSEPIWNWRPENK
jgi:hypothetical protein